MKEARYGDIVRVSLGLIYHYGIFVSEEEVIQFGLPPTPNRKAEDVEVLSSHVSDFLAGGFLEVGQPERQEKKNRRTPEQTVLAARARLGERGYDIIRNNCEHFANECAFGAKFSSMTDGLRARFRAIPVVHVYVSKFPFDLEDSRILPKAREKEIESCSNTKVKQQKYYVWKLLETALMRSFGLKLANINIKKQDSGKWECDECYFSLSHSDDFVAVAVSRKPVGVDIEKLNPQRFTEALLEKIATVSEQDELNCSGDLLKTYLNILWTKKEAIFKLLGDKTFQPKSIESSKYSSLTKKVQDENGQYFVTVASEDAKLAIFRNAEGITVTDIDEL